MITLFRTLVVVSTALAVVGYALPYLDARLHGPEVVDLRAWDGFTAALTYTTLPNAVLTALGLILPVFLYFFVWWARRAYLIFIVVSAGASLLWGVRVTTPLEMFIWYVVALCDGAILTMAYLTSVGPRFERTAAQQGVPGDVAASRRRA